LEERVWAPWLEAAWHPDDPGRREDLLGALTLVGEAMAGRSIGSPLLLAALAAVVDSAMYWQEPDDQQRILVDPAVRAALAPVAAAVAAAPAARWWTGGADLDRLRHVQLIGDTRPGSGPMLAGAAEQLRLEHDATVEDERRAEQRPTDPTAPYGGTWWSTPGQSTLIRTTRPADGLGALGLALVEDGFGEEDAIVRALRTVKPPRVYEIDGPAAWMRLVERYPLKVSRARRHDWFRATGRVGSWHIPNWPAVANDYDAVHLTVAGYLTTAGRALPVDGSATVLAGWNPDETYWLNDLLTLEHAPEERWNNRDARTGPDLQWRRS
jgi:hypothetical protein